MNDNLRPGEISELARLLPTPAERDLPAGREETLKEHLMSEFRMLDASGPRPTPARRRRRRIPAIAAGAGVLAAAVAAAVVIPGAGRGPSPVSQSEAAVLLSKIAVAASRQPSPVVRDSQYEYVSSVAAERRSWAAFGDRASTTLPRAYHPPSGPLVRVYQRSWVPVDDVCRVGLIRTILPHRKARDDYFSSGGSVGCPSTGSLNDSTYGLLETLPTSPGRLLRLIYTVEKGHGPGPAQEAFTTIGDMLRDSIAPPKVSAALYRAAALIPGVTTVPDAVNAVGRHGVAVALTIGHRPRAVQEWIFDKTTLQLIGDATITDGKVVDASAILGYAFVDHLGQLPAARG